MNRIKQQAQPILVLCILTHVHSYIITVKCKYICVGAKFYINTSLLVLTSPMQCLLAPTHIHRVLTDFRLGYRD